MRECGRWRCVCVFVCLWVRVPAYHASSSPALAHGHLDANPSVPHPAVLLVDPFCDYLGKAVKSEALRRGLQCVEVVSSYNAMVFGKQGRPVPPHLVAPAHGEELEWFEQHKDKHFTFVFSESDAGLEDAERLQVALNITGNERNEAFRNKYILHESLKHHKLNHIRQVLASEWSQAEDFIDKLWKDVNVSHRCIVKPPRGVASTDVHMCTSIEEAKIAFDKVTGAHAFGSRGLNNSHVLVQQFIEGQEYALDTVSSNGTHKLLALWEYDKRAANGAPFVYHATKLVNSTTVPHLKVMLDYVYAAFDALGLKWGPTHTEVIMNPAGNCVIVEINTRFQAAQFLPITEECVGYSSPESVLDAYTNSERFKLLPDLPVHRKHGYIVHLVASVHGGGKIRRVKQEKQIRKLASVRELQIYYKKGDDIHDTVDIRTDSGQALLWHEDERTLKQDFEKILELQKDMFEICGRGFFHRLWARLSQIKKRL